LSFSKQTKYPLLVRKEGIQRDTLNFDSLISTISQSPSLDQDTNFFFKYVCSFSKEGLLNEWPLICNIEKGVIFWNIITAKKPIFSERYTAKINSGVVKKLRYAFFHCFLTTHSPMVMFL